MSLDAESMNVHPGSGWGWPGASRKAHYFANSMTSICGKWLFGGPREKGNDNSPDNCAECKRRLRKLQSTGVV